MTKKSTSKIEKMALNLLENIIDSCDNMDYKFNSDDKEMSWDGYISLYKSDKHSKETFDDRVQVQIKGHIDEKKKYIDKKHINYSVSLNDLKVYSKEKGVIYFQIFQFEKQKEIFYSSLYPSKIADYLDKAKERHNVKSITIKFFKIEKNCEAIYNLAKQFSIEALRQGTAYTPLVKNRIKKSDFENLNYIKVDFVSTVKPYDIIELLFSRTACMYGKINDDKYERPLECTDAEIVAITKTINKDIIIGGKTYYKKYNGIKSSTGETKILISENLILNLVEKKFEFQRTSTIKELYNDAKFLLELNKKQKFNIAGCEIKVSGLINENFKKVLLFHIKIYEAFKMIGFDTQIKWDKFTDENFYQIKKLYSVIYNENNCKLDSGSYIYLWEFEKKSIPILIIKNDNNSIEFLNAMYSNKLQAFIYENENDNNSKIYKLPLFVNLSEETLSNLYYYDYELIKKQIDYSDINQKTKQIFNDCIFLLINVFDLNKISQILNIAEYILQKLNYPKKDKLNLVISLFIKSRKKGLSINDIKLLEHINDYEEDVKIQFGKYVLLGNKKKAYKVYENFSNEQKEEYMVKSLLNYIK